MTTRTPFHVVEADYLLRLADTLTDAIFSAPSDEKVAWKAWRDAVHEVRSEPHDSLATEHRLAELANEFRCLWLTRAHRCSISYFYSPPLVKAPTLPGGQPVPFSYERNIQPTNLEERVAAGVSVPDGWQSAHVVYSSGMAAITNLLQGYHSMTRPSVRKPLLLGMWGAYFETEVLLEYLRSETFQPRQFDALDDLCAEIRNGSLNALFVEPVRYNWELEAIDLTEIVRAWRSRRSASPNVLIIDTTLVSPRWPTRQLLSALDPHAPDLVVEVRSGIKLDQQGLELANVGVVSLYTAGLRPGAAEIARLLRKMRTITGSAPTMDALAALDAPFVLSREWTRRHADAIFLNNALAATILSRQRGLFSRIVHPSLNAGPQMPWAQSPFVVCHLAEDNLENHGFLLSVVELEARRRGLNLRRGSSFGFREHRFETIIPKLREGRGLFKIAMGATSGPSRDGIVSLFVELASYENFAALRAAYPDVQAVDLTDLEP